MKALNFSQDKSFKLSFGLHAGLLLFFFFPIAQKVAEQETVEYILETAYYEEIVVSGSEGLQARSHVYNESPEPTSEEPAEELIPVVSEEPAEEIQMADESSEYPADVVQESDVEVVAEVAEDQLGAEGADVATSANGGGEGSPIEGDQDGGALAGDGGGGDGLEGDGIITRKVVYRENITGVAKESGKITLDLCIDRQGKVIYVAYDPVNTTITDNDIIRQASHLAARYRFEAKYNAPKRECGKLTFIFRVDKPIESL
jgi:hypothetical protein